jgi:hypothetical protein
MDSMMRVTALTDLMMSVMSKAWQEVSMIVIAGWFYSQRAVMHKPIDRAIKTRANNGVWLT